jgi:hypothetical protein
MEALWFYAVQELSGWGIYICVCVCVCDFLVIWGGFYAVMLVIG